MILEANSLYTSYYELDMKKMEKKANSTPIYRHSVVRDLVIIMMSYGKFVCKVRLQYSFLFIPY